MKRRKRTSAAMIGLALSMGASSLLIPRQNEGATAAEPTPTDAATISTTPSTAAPAASLAEHVVSKGQTLSQLARQYQVDVNAIATANGFKAGQTLAIGQVVLIPAADKPTQPVTQAPAPQVVATSNLTRLPAGAKSTEQTFQTAKTERDASLNRLRQQQDKLRQSLADLKAKEKAPQAAVAPEASGERSEAYQVRPGDTVTTIAHSHNVSEQALIASNQLANPDWLRVNQALTIPETATPTLITEAPRSTPAATPVRVPIAATRPTTVPAVQQVAAKPEAQMVSYQVNPGDTVARIARAHNISPSILVQTNRISDPNFIFVGQVLRVPAAQIVASNVEQANPQTLSYRQPTDAQPTVAQPTVAQPAAAQPAPATVIPQTTENSGVGGSLPTAAASVSGFDPHVQNLLADIKVMRERHRAQSLAASAPAPITTTPEPQAVRLASTLPSLSVGTQFNPRGLSTIETAPTTARSQTIRVPAAETARQPEQVAAAPAGSESYAPLLEPVSGRMVSPDLPPLQGEDNFLPEGAPSFNGYIWPSKGELTSGYGWRWGRMHQGIDIAADVGTPVFAASDGVVEYSGWNSGGYGNLVEIRHPDGSMTRYAHLNQSLVQEGQKVKQGEQIAEMGSTGYSTGPHLHFEVHVASDGGTVDPMAYLPQQ